MCTLMYKNNIVGQQKNHWKSTEKHNWETDQKTEVGMHNIPLVDPCHSIVSMIVPLQISLPLGMAMHREWFCSVYTKA